MNEWLYNKYRLFGLLLQPDFKLLKDQRSSNCLILPWNLNLINVSWIKDNENAWDYKESFRPRNMQTKIELA